MDKWYSTKWYICKTGKLSTKNNNNNKHYYKLENEILFVVLYTIDFFKFISDRCWNSKHLVVMIPKHISSPQIDKSNKIIFKIG